MATEHENSNIAPYPDALHDIVEKLEYRKGYHFELEHLDRGQGSEGLTFKVLSDQFDTYNPESRLRVWHFFPVPAAAYNRQSWLRWVLDRLVEIETHEACEFMVVDGQRPFAPNHGPGWDPYTIRELNDPEAAETSFRGERDEGSQGA
jgi:hypothetical protein